MENIQVLLFSHPCVLMKYSWHMCRVIEQQPLVSELAGTSESESTDSSSNSASLESCNL